MYKCTQQPHKNVLAPYSVDFVVLGFCACRCVGSGFLAQGLEAHDLRLRNLRLEMGSGLSTSV